ncbi:response regulator [Flavobacterium sp. DSR3-2]|uniref:response regulator n=1 Tax=Flavobacterium sp. DSR3-2 TaxID=2804634 RepID=UPI003CEB01E6
MINPNIKLVLIEDDLALGNSISELLTLSGFEVKWFKDGNEALINLNINLPDIIISDLMMPIMNGEELFLRIRQNKKFSTIPFIIITANIDDDVKIKQLKNGVNDFIMKPFKVVELIYKIKNLISLKNNFEKKFRPDPFSRITIKLSKKDFLTSLDEVLAKNIKSKVNIDNLCSELFISKSTLDKRIRKLTSKNASQYIREFKLDYAVNLIHLGERNIQYLVDETGFSSFSYFSTSFKLYLDLSPRDFIKSTQLK